MTMQDIGKIKNFCKVEKINNAEVTFFPVLTGSWGCGYGVLSPPVKIILLVCLVFKRIG